MQNYIENQACRILQTVFISASLAATGCGADKITEDKASPPLLEASLSSPSISQGESVALSWRADPMDTVTLWPGNIVLAANGTIELTPATSTQYVLSSKNNEGNVVRVLDLEVDRDPAAPLEPTLTSIYAFGRSVTLAWSSSSDDVTPPDELVYRIYYSEFEPSLNKNELVYLGESVGINEFTVDDLPASSRLHFYVSAVDSDANESNLSADEAITTGSVDPVLRTDIVLIDLEEAMVSYDKTDTTVIIKDMANSESFPVNDVIISYKEDDPFVGAIKERDTLGPDLILQIEPMSIFDLYSAGSFNAVFKGERDVASAETIPEDGTDVIPLNVEQRSALEPSIRGSAAVGGILYDYETDIGPLNIKAKLDFKPKFEISYEFGSPIKANGRLYGDWNAEIATKILGEGSHSLEEEFTIDPLSFEAQYKAKVKARKAFTFMFRLKTVVNGYASLNAEGTIDVSATARAFGFIDEKFNYEGSLSHESGSSVPAIEITPTVSAIGNAKALVSMRPVVNVVTVQGALDVTAEFNQDYSVEVGVESVPEQAVVSEVYPEQLIQLTNLDLGWETKCSIEARMFGVIPLKNDNGCEEQYKLFSIPEMSLSERVDQNCTHTISANDEIGTNSKIDDASASWFSKAAMMPLLRGPMGAMTWEHPSAETQTTAIFSATTAPLGEASRRFVPEYLKDDYVATYHVRDPDHEVFAEDGYYASGATVEEACEKFGEVVASWNTGWLYRRAADKFCVVAFGPVDGPEIDAVFFPAHVKKQCR